MSYKEAECLVWPIPLTAFESLSKKMFSHIFRVNALKMLSTTIACQVPVGNHLVVWGKGGTYIVNFR